MYPRKRKDLLQHPLGGFLFNGDRQIVEKGKKPNDGSLAQAILPFRRKQDVTCRKGLDGGDEGFSRCKVVEDSFRVAVPLVAKTPCHDN